MTIFHFPMYWIIGKSKSMGNCISKINKDHFFYFWRGAENDIIFIKGKTRRVIEMCARGKKYTGIHSIKKYSKTFAPLQTEMWWRNLWNELTLRDILCYSKSVKHCVTPFRIIFKHFLFFKISWSLTLDVSHTRTLCFGLWTAHFLVRSTYTMLSRKLHLDPFRLPHCNLFSCAIK